ncbi:MAG: hypothetical protein IT518_13605 [Burkholderiales bacterium]|nr:hypothetical protein [Burkholderiales bacterium]
MALVRRLLLALCIALAGCGGGGDGGSAPEPPPPPEVNGPAWPNFGRDAQHAAQGAVATQPLSRIVWQAPVDLVPPYLAGNVLHIHYGSPVISARNTVLVPVKLNRDRSFRLEARAGGNGALLWTEPTDYVLPVHDWVPSYNVALTSNDRVYFPGAGGKVYFRDNVDAATGPVGFAVFYGREAYDAARTTYDNTVIVNTPLTVDADGNVFFGFIVAGPTPAGLASGIARIAPDGTGTWVGARAASGNPAMTKVATNSAPSVSRDRSVLYVAVNTTVAPPARATGMLLALDARTLATRAAVDLRDPTGAPGWVNDNSSASPSVAPDGDVYFGVLESNAPAHNFRGWLLHYDATLTQAKLSGSFGWDQTVSFAPAAMVPQYVGPSSYLVVSKYNNYFGVGTGNGRNAMAILDPAQGQADFVAPGVLVMREVLTMLGPTPQAGLPAGAVREWCVNTTAVDPLTGSILVNSEDGHLYRWHLPTNSLTQNVRFNNGYAESYTPTAIGPDGKVYAINNATLFAVGQ